MTGKAYCILLICDYVCVKCACACVVSELVLFVRQTNVTYNIVQWLQPSGSSPSYEASRDSSGTPNSVQPPVECAFE